MSVDRVAGGDVPGHDLGLGQALAQVGQEEAAHVAHALLQAPVDLVEDAVGVGQEVALELGRRVRRGEAADPAHRRLEVVEAALRDAGGDLRPEAAEDRRLVRDDQPSGLAHRRLERVEVDRRERAQVDDLERGSLLRGRSGRLQRGRHHRAVGGDGDVGALGRRPGPVQRHARRAAASSSTSPFSQ